MKSKNSKALVAVKKSGINRIFPGDTIDYYKRHVKAGVRDKFNEWFFEHGKGEVLSHEKCGEYLAKQLNRDITMNLLRSYVGSAREHLERNKGVTIWNVLGKGWRIATEKEKAIHLIRSARTTIKWGERAVRLYEITEHKLIPDAIKYVFGSSAKAMEQVKGYEHKFKALFGSNNARSMLK